jgi:hypothetical protein
MNALQITNQVPFAASIYDWLTLNQVNIQAFEATSHQYDVHYLAWQMVRKERNPYFVNGTGFEGYFVGTCPTPESALTQILAISQQILENIALLHRFEYQFRSMLMKTLVGEKYNLRAVYEWNALLGEALTRLRWRAMQDLEAAAFREETYRLIGVADRFSEIHYLNDTRPLRQEYFVVHNTQGTGHRLLVNSDGLKTQDQDAWLVAQSVGRFGHPLVRTCLHREIQDHGLRAA